jgi:hypothetical protein
MSWRDTGIGRGGKEVCDDVLGFWGFGIREFEMRELLASGISDIPMGDELLLLGTSPYQLEHGPYDLSLCDRSQTLHRSFGVHDDTMFVSTRLAIFRLPMRLPC